MALQKSVTTEQGFFAENAYHRVEELKLITKDTILFQVRSYKDTSGLPQFADVSYSCPYDLENKNPLEQAYEYLKTLSEFENAVDC